MHREELAPLFVPLRRARGEGAGCVNEVQHFGESFELRRVAALAQLRDRRDTRRVDRGDEQQIAGVDPRIDEVNGDADRVAMECGPFGDVHAAIERKQPHVRIQRSDSGEFEQRLLQDSCARADEDVGTGASHGFEPRG